MRQLQNDQDDAAIVEVADIVGWPLQRLRMALTRGFDADDQEATALSAAIIGIADPVKMSRVIELLEIDDPSLVKALKEIQIIPPERRVLAGLDAGVLRQVATLVGWSFERMNCVLEGIHSAGDSPAESADVLAGLIAQIENSNLQRSKMLEMIEQRMIDLAAEACNAQHAISRELWEREAGATADKFRMPILPGFTPTSFPALLVTFKKDVPTIGADIVARIGLSTDDAIKAISRLEFMGLLTFAINERNQPASFMAAEDDFKNPDDLRVAHAVVGFFEHSGYFDTKTGLYRTDRKAGDKISGIGGITVKEWSEKSSEDFKRISRHANIANRIVLQTLEGLEARGMLALKFIGSGFAVHVLIKDYATSTTRTEKLIIETVTRLFGAEFEDGRVKMLDKLKAASEPGEHTYMRAIEMQYAALEDLLKAVAVARVTGQKMANNIPAADNWHLECRVLKQAETFCWFEEPTKQVVSAAISLFSTVRLEADITPCEAGWWFFDVPLDIKTTEDDDRVVAMSWAWASINARGRSDEWFGKQSADRGARRGVIMSAYIMGDSGVPLPSTEFFWSEGVELRTMLVDVERSLRKTHEGDQRAIGNLPLTMIACDAMARFFAAGCLWMQQKILTNARRPMERHARKRLEKEKGDLRPISDIQIIQLRRREAQPATSTEPAATPSDGTKREYSCQWVVGGANGFWRNQWFPSKGYHKPIHIEPYAQGPKDKPFKVPTHRVFAVKR